MRRLLLLIVALIAASAAQAEKRAAFLVGNSEYRAAPLLQNPKADVALIADALEGLDFDVTTRFDLSRSQIAQDLDAFLDANADADVTLFYFAGHGMQFENRNFLLGVDADLKSVFDVESGGLELARVIDLLSRKSKSALVFVDACRDNPLATRFYTENVSSTRAGMTRGLARLSTAFNGTMVTYSASPGQLAYDGEGGNSPFAAALARHLPSEDMEVLSLMKRVTRDVRSATGGQQTPMVSNDLVQEIFLKRGEGGEAAAIAYREEERLFEAAKAINTPRAWSVFFERFPDGQLYQEAVEASETSTAIDLASRSGLEDPQSFVASALKRGARLDISKAAYETAEKGLGAGPDIIRQVQQALKDRGYDVGPVDGIPGTATRKAIADFQAAVGLPSTGAMTAGTVARLGIDTAQAETGEVTFASSDNARRYDPIQLALFEDDKRLLRAIEALRDHELVYGYFNDHLYLGVLTWRFMPFDEAENLAERAGGYLAAIGSAAENDFVYDLIRNDLRMWRRHSDGRATAFGPSFGLYQLDDAREPDGGWVWVTGEPVRYTNWLPGSPINANGNGKYAAFIWDRWPQKVPGPIQTAKTWHDMDMVERAIVIEIE